MIHVMSPFVLGNPADKVTTSENNQMPANSHLPNAPLVFVLGVVRFSPYPNFAQKIDNLHEALLDQFPEIERIGGVVLKSFEPSGPKFEPNELWRIYNRISNSSLLLGSEQLVFEWTHYKSFDDALETSLKSLQKIFDLLPNITPNQVALRYINVLIDNEPLPIDKAVIPELRGFRFDNTSLINGETSTAQQFDNSGVKLVTRFSRGQKKSGEIISPRGIVVPNVLKPNKKLSSFNEFEGPYGLLDIDGVIDTDITKNSAADILNLFEELRNDMRPVLSHLVEKQTSESWS